MTSNSVSRERTITWSNTELQGENINVNNTNLRHREGMAWQIEWQFISGVRPERANRIAPECAVMRDVCSPSRVHGEDLLSAETLAAQSVEQILEGD